MARFALLLTALLTACATPVELSSHHAHTAAVCGWELQSVDDAVFEPAPA